MQSLTTGTKKFSPNSEQPSTDASSSQTSGHGAEHRCGVSAPLQGLGFSAWGECFLLQQQGLTPDQSSWEGTNKAALAARSSQAKLAKTAVALRTAVPKSKASQALSNDHQGILHKWKKNPKPAVSILQNQQSSNFNFFLTWFKPAAHSGTRGSTGSSIGYRYE